MPISLNIPINILTPGHYIEIDNSRALQGLPIQPHKILVFGQRLSTGTVAQAVPKRVLSGAQAAEFFGYGSMLHRMLAALKEVNDFTEVWAIAMSDNGAGALASGTITTSASPTENGTLNVYIDGRRVQVAITSGMTAAQAATAIAAAINADTFLPVTAAAVSAVVTLTAHHRGENGNTIDVRLNYYLGDKTPAGLGVAIVAMSGGTTNPSVATAIAAIGDEQYHTVVMPWADDANLDALEAELADRFGPMEQKEGQGFTCFSGTHGAISTLGDARNSPHTVAVGRQKSPTSPEVIAAVVAAIDAYESDPARPRQTLVMEGVLAPLPEDVYTRSERQLHLQDGVATFYVDAGGLCRIERLVTTYKTNAFAVEDPSYRDNETLRTLAYLRYTVRARIALKFPRVKLKKYDGVAIPPGQAMVTERDIRNELIALFQQWQDQGLAEDMDQFKRDLIVEIDANDPNRVNAIIPPNTVNQFRVFAGSVQFRL